MYPHIRFITLLIVTLFSKSAYAVLGSNLSTVWTLTPGGTTGVVAGLASFVSPNLVLFLDKVHNNPLTTPNGDPAWGALYNIDTDTATPLIGLYSNTFTSDAEFYS